MDPPPAAPPRLETRNLCRRFDDRLVVNNVSLSLRPGQITCLLGASGCGKSTTLRMIAGVETQDSGEIYLDGRLICDSTAGLAAEQRQIGLMFQDFALFPHLDVGGNVAFALHGRAYSKAQKRAQARTMLGKVGLAGAIARYPHMLSGGEQQRVALARALARRPCVMLMDEPFSGLDHRLRDEIRDETLALLRQADTAVLLVTHEPAEAMRMADQIALMRRGRIVQQGAPYNIYNAPVDREAMAFFSDINVLRGVSRGALTETPFGRFLTPGHADGAAVDIAIRPQHLKLDFDRRDAPAPAAPQPETPASTITEIAARGVVIGARFMGVESLIEMRMEYDGSVLKASVPNVFLPPLGTALRLRLRRDRCLVFPAQQDGPACARAQSA
ncbi:MAG: ABC transporter ATP-binding protein [Rhodobacteraceae bacterium]|nr:ABC transporter ATP-binding protein [Paracoccaceae bacterium]